MIMGISCAAGDNVFAIMVPVAVSKQKAQGETLITTLTHSKEKTL
jgi:hypothetical protein